MSQPRSASLGMFEGAVLLCGLLGIRADAQFKWRNQCSNMRRTGAPTLPTPRPRESMAQRLKGNQSNLLRRARYPKLFHPPNEVATGSKLVRDGSSWAEERIRN